MTTNKQLIHKKLQRKKVLNDHFYEQLQRSY